MGIPLSIAAAFFFAFSLIGVRRGVRHMSVLTSTAIMLLAGAVTTFLLAAVLEGFRVLHNSSLIGALYFAAAGVIHFLGGWGFQNASAHRIGATRVSAMTSLTPLFATLLAFFTFHQKVNPSVMAGIVLMVIGVYAITGGNDS